MRHLNGLNREHIGAISAVALCFAYGFTAVAVAQDFGDPLPGLTAEQLALFEDGKLDFEEVETVEEGLGPTFNEKGCAVCHASPAVGGARSRGDEVRAGQLIAGSFFNFPGGSLFQIKAIRGECQEDVPKEANVIALRQTQPLFGMGLIEAIPDSTILAQADPNDLNGDGISGKAATVFDNPHPALVGAQSQRSVSP